MVRGRLLAAFLAAAITGTPGAGQAAVLDLVRRICLGELLPYGGPIRSAANGDTASELAPGDPEYDRSVVLLPAPPTGWSAEPAKIQVFSSHTIGCGFRVARTYRLNEKDLTFSLLFASGVKQLQDDLAKPTPDVTPPERILEFKGRKGYDRSEAPDPDLILVVGSMMLSIDGSATDSEMRALLDTVDLDAIETFRF